MIKLLWSRQRGQTIVETILILPLFMLFVFGLLEAGEIGVALVTASYAAGSIARHQVQAGSQPNDAQDRLNSLVFAGMKAGKVTITQPPSGPGAVGAIGDLKVAACIAVPPLPFVGPFLNKVLGDHSDGADTCDDSTNASLGPLYFVPQGEAFGHYYFVVRGEALARQNYYH